MAFHKSQNYFKEKLNGSFVAAMLAIVESTLRDHVDPTSRNANKSGSPDEVFQSKGSILHYMTLTGRVDAYKRLVKQIFTKELKAKKIRNNYLEWLVGELDKMLGGAIVEEEEICGDPNDIDMSDDEADSKADFFMALLHPQPKDKDADAESEGETAGDSIAEQTNSTEITEITEITENITNESSDTTDIAKDAPQTEPLDNTPTRTFHIQNSDHKIDLQPCSFHGLIHALGAPLLRGRTTPFNFEQEMVYYQFEGMAKGIPLCESDNIDFLFSAEVKDNLVTVWLTPDVSLAIVAISTAVLTNV